MTTITKPNMTTATNDEIRAYYKSRSDERYLAWQERYEHRNNGLYYFLAVSFIGVILVAMI